jgi:hypothetical protein
MVGKLSRKRVTQWHKKKPEGKKTKLRRLVYTRQWGYFSGNPEVFQVHGWMK